MDGTTGDQWRDAAAAYVSDIPPEAEARVEAPGSEGSERVVAYYLDGELVGRRYYNRDELEDETPYRRSIKEGMAYRWHRPGRLLSACPYANGLPHGIARQWDEHGRYIGSYAMDRGTGVDLWWNTTVADDGSVALSEVHYTRGGCAHGVEWWLNLDGQSVWHERFHWDGAWHGIERQWNAKGRLHRGYPAYWISSERVTKRQYERACVADETLRRYQADDNDPHREFPPEVAEHLRVWPRG